MKKLLVLTDFTANAAHAEAAALRLSAGLGAGVILYHAMLFISTMPSDSLGPYVSETASALFENSRQRLQQEADQMKNASANIEGLKPDIEYMNGEGSLGDLIEELSEEPEIEMIIMGGRSGGAMEHLLTGSDTAAVIRKASKPVLIIPPTVTWGLPGKIVFATDFGIADIPAVDFLLQWSKLPGFYMDVVHIIKQGEVVANIGSEVAFRKYLLHEQVNYIRLFCDDVRLGLQQYCKEHSVDILAMSHGHHSFISRLFRHSESRAAIAGKQLAVLIFPPDFK